MLLHFLTTLTTSYYLLHYYSLHYFILVKTVKLIKTSKFDLFNYLSELKSCILNFKHQKHSKSKHNLCTFIFLHYVNSCFLCIKIIFLIIFLSSFSRFPITESFLIGALLPSECVLHIHSFWWVRDYLLPSLSPSGDGVCICSVNVTVIHQNCFVVSGDVPSS